MPLRRCLSVLMVTAVVAGCASNTIAPRYTSDHPDILRIGGERPANKETIVENAGSFCLETSERWNEHGRTPDGQTLWAKDTLRRVVRCN